MKIIILALLLCFTLVIPVGCTSPLKSTFTQVEKAPKTVEQVLKDWNTYIETHPGKVTLQMNNNVRELFLKWKRLTLNVIDIGHQMSSTNTNSVPKADLEVALHSQMAESAKASNDLINLVKTYSK